MEITKLADQFAALGNEARLKILFALVRAPQGRCNATQVQEQAGMAASTTSHHLDKLFREGLVARQRQGTTLWYSPNWECLQDLIQVFARDCCGGQCDVDFSCCARNECSTP